MTWSSSRGPGGSIAVEEMLTRPAQDSIHRRDTDHGSGTVAPVASDLRVGTRMAGYDIKSVAGRGGMGVVYRAEHVHLGRTVALKVLLPGFADSGDFRERFLRESRTAAAINHPNIITVYDAGEADGLLYIAMQYVEGTDLATLLRGAGELEPPEAVFLLEQVASALDAAHKHGVVHRDVKPENILMAGNHCYLTDFGAGKRISSERSLTAHGQFVGTIDYMAPEQIEGGAIDGRADVYALGCVLYHAFAGRPPFEKDSEVSVIYAHLHEPVRPLSSLQPELPARLDPVLARALAKRPGDRYATCCELIAAVEAATSEGAPHTTEDSVEPAAAPATKVLVVGAAPVAKAIVRATLPPDRFEIFDAPHGAAALELGRQQRPALVLLDASTSGPSAVEVCSGLRADPATASTKIVGMATRESRDDLRALSAAGADDCLVTPFSSLQVLYKVRDLLGPALVSD